MQPQDIEEYINSLREQLEVLSSRLLDPAVYSNPAEMKKISREHRKLEQLFSDFSRWKKSLAELAGAEKMAISETDADLRLLADEEVQLLNTSCIELEQKLQLALIPPDPNDDKNIIVEIHPAAGGDEAALFAGDLFRLYSRYAEKCGWKQEVLELTNSDLGGIKFAAFSLSGDDVYSGMKFEAGVHRVQRVPATEASGRIHTSTVTVAVMPEADEVEINVRQEDLRFDVFRSSGPGGQCVNTTDSAVRVTHIPTGLSVASQQEKSQHRNKEIALRILYARLLEIKQAEQNASLAADKRSQVGTGDRSERIRTYNFPQNRVTDHRFNISSFDLTKILEGELDLILAPVKLIVCEQALANLNK